MLATIAEARTVQPITPPRTARLPLRDELYLLGHDDDYGKPYLHPQSLAVGMAGAVLIELYALGRTTVEDGRIVVHRREPTGDLITDNALAAIRAHRTLSPPLKPWLRAAADDLYQRVRANLVTVGVLRHIPRRIRADLYVPVDTAWGVRVRAQLRYVLCGRDRPDAQCAALCGLIAVLGLEEYLYTDGRRGDLRAQLRYLGDRHHPPVTEIIAAVDTVLGDLATAVYR
jgi:hypothetical protein